MGTATNALQVGLASHVRHPAVLRACAYLEAHCGRQVPLDELARACFASKFHLLRTLKSCVGVTPGEYHVRLRLGRARELLEAGLSATRVAYETGFSDQSHLTRAFKRAFGLPPGRYAAAFARGTAFGAPALVHAEDVGLAAGAAGALPDAGVLEEVA
jgi:transcriptional regulator GlxA family with amidase domain